MRIGIIGGGAKGLFLCAFLLKLGHHVNIYVRRQSQKKQLIQKGITLLPTNEKYPVHAFLHTELQNDDFLFVCVKQYHLPALINSLREVKAPILFLQNGMSHLDLILEHQIQSTIAVATSEHGVMRIDDATVAHKGSGKINIALFRGNHLEVQKLKHALDHNTFPVHISEDWRKMLSEKLIVNAVINPLTALFQMKNGGLLTNPHLTKLGKQLCSEAASVLTLNADEQWEKVKQVAEKTRLNESSMKVDISNYKQTEIDGISGYLLKHANSDIPYTRFIYTSIKALEWQQKRVDVDG